jgi:peroxiredoxin
MTTPKNERRSTVVITLIAAGIFFLGAAIIPLLAKAQQKSLEAGITLSPVTANYPAPKLAFTDLQGNPASLSDYHGQVVLVNNWATWCPPCQVEMPELQAYYQAHAADGFVILAIESGEPADIVDKFVKQYKLTFPVWLDPKGAALDAFQNWNLPSSYIIDRSGNVRLVWMGGVNQAVLEKYVTPLIGGE